MKPGSLGAAFAIALLSALAPAAATASTAYVSAGPTGSQKLYSVDMETHMATQIGPTTKPIPVEALALAGNLSLYGIGGESSPKLDQIDRATAAPVSSELPLPPMNGVNNVPGLAFGPEESLWASSFTVEEPAGGQIYNSKLWHIDLGTGEAQFRGRAGGDETILAGLAYGCYGTMYGAVEESAGWELDRVDLTDGALTEVGPMNGPDGMEDLDVAFDYSTDTLYALSGDGSLYAVNTSTGAATMVLPVMSGSTQLGEIAGFTIDSTGGCRPPPECKEPAATCPPPPRHEETHTQPTPTPPSCVVPKLKGKTLRRAKAALKAANCTLGKVRRPRHAKGKLVVKSSSPGPGTSLATRATVNLKLKEASRARAR
jgi:hypothetical protein